MLSAALSDRAILLGVIVPGTSRELGHQLPRQAAERPRPVPMPPQGRGI